MNLFRRKSVASLQAEAEGDKSLKRALGPVNLTALGIGAIIGTGIFVLTGTVAALNAGPGVIISFIIAGLASVFAALCYSEFASMVPMSGSAYTYGYCTFGELIAWIIGWDLVLEYAVGAITVAVGWSGYVVSFLKGTSLAVPPEFTAAAGTQLINIPAQLASTLSISEGWQQLSASLTAKIASSGVPLESLTKVTTIFNAPAVVIVFIVTVLLVVGIKESAAFNNVIVVIKLAVVLIFIFGAASAVNPDNWTPLIPENTGERDHFGWTGIMAGAGLVFFAYIGFDAVSTAAQEAKNPQRDMPIGIIGSLIVCTVLYIAVSAIATGVVPYKQLDVPAPIALVADHAGMGWMATLIKIGAIAGLSSVIMVMMLGQSRVFYSMARDGLLPKFVQSVHPKFQTPWLTSIGTGLVVAFFSAIFTVREAGELCSIGTLLAFVIVCIGVLILRMREPNLPRVFKTPAVWFVAPAGALSALYLMVSLPLSTWIRLIVWFGIGMVVYFSYGAKHSKLNQTAPGK